MTSKPRLFELRTYRAAPGKFDALQDRFRDHTLTLFEKHNMTVAGFWIPLDPSGQPVESLVYLLAFENREAAEQAWAGFRGDPEWARARQETERDGVLTSAVESIFLTPTDFSPLT